MLGKMEISSEGGKAQKNMDAAAVFNKSCGDIFSEIITFTRTETEFWVENGLHFFIENCVQVITV